MNDCGHVSTSRAELRDQACRLRDEGLGYSLISRELDVPYSTVKRWTDAEYAERQRAVSRAVKERYRGTCIDCGRPTNGSNGPNTASAYCLHCAPNAYYKVWTRERIIDAIRRYAYLNGRPPRAHDWKRADPINGFPCFSNVYKNTGAPNAPFDNWADAIHAAGFPRPDVGRYGREGTAGLHDISIAALRFVADNSPCAPSHLRAKIGGGRGRANGLLASLQQRGLVERVRPGLYSLTTAGAFALTER